MAQTLWFLAACMAGFGLGALVLGQWMRRMDRHDRERREPPPD